MREQPWKWQEKDNNKHSSKLQRGWGHSFCSQGREISSIFDIVLWRSHLISSQVLCGWPAAINYHWQDLCTRKAVALCLALPCHCEAASSEITNHPLSQCSIFLLTAGLCSSQPPVWRPYRTNYGVWSGHSVSFDILSKFYATVKLRDHLLPEICDMIGYDRP